MIKVVSVVSFSVIVSLLGLGAAQRVFPPQKESQPPRNKFESHVRVKTGKAIPIQEGVMTDKQKKHSRIFKGFGLVTRGKKLSDLTAEGGDVIVIKDAEGGGTPVNFNLEEFLLEQTCEADAVVVGTVRSKSSQLLEEGTFIFTDYEIAVTEILKNNTASPISPAGIITFTSPGGAVELNGRTFRAIDYRREPLLMGEAYLLYLKSIPETGAYKGFSKSWAADTFQISGDKLIQASRKAQPLGVKRTAEVAPFMAQARASLNRACSN